MHSNETYLADILKRQVQELDFKVVSMDIVKGFFVIDIGVDDYVYKVSVKQIGKTDTPVP